MTKLLLAKRNEGFSSLSSDEKVASLLSKHKTVIEEFKKVYKEVRGLRVSFTAFSIKTKKRLDKLEGKQ